MDSELNPTLISLAQPPARSLIKSVDGQVRGKENAFADVYKSLYFNKKSMTSATSSQVLGGSERGARDYQSEIRREASRDRFVARTSFEQESSADRAAITSSRRHFEERQDVASARKHEDHPAVAADRNHTEKTANNSNAAPEKRSNTAEDNTSVGRVRDNLAETGHAATQGDGQNLALSNDNAQASNKYSLAVDGSQAQPAVNHTADGFWASAASVEGLDGDLPITPDVTGVSAVNTANRIPVSDEVVAAHQRLESSLAAPQHDALGLALDQNHRPIGSLSALVGLSNQPNNAAQHIPFSNTGGSLSTAIGHVLGGDMPGVEGNADKQFVLTSTLVQSTSPTVSPTNKLIVDLHANPELATKLTDHVNAQAAQVPKTVDLLGATESKLAPEGQAAASGLSGLLNAGLLKNRELAYLKSPINSAIVGAVDEAQSATRMVATRPSGETVSAALLSTPTARLAAQTPLSSGQWPIEVGEHVRMLINRGFQSAELQLNPQSLGLLQVRVETVEDQARVFFNVQTAAAKEQIDAQLPRLKELFMSTNVDLLDVDVNTQGRNPDESTERNAEQISNSEGAELAAQSERILLDSETNWSQTELSTALLDTFA